MNHTFLPTFKAELEILRKCIENSMENMHADSEKGWIEHNDSLSRLVLQTNVC